MTPLAIGAAVALVLAVGWILLRAKNRPATGIESGDGDHVLLDRSPVGALLIDRGLRITWLNHAFCDTFGLNRRWWVGREMSMRNCTTAGDLSFPASAVIRPK